MLGAPEPDSPPGFMSDTEELADSPPGEPADGDEEEPDSPPGFMSEEELAELDASVLDSPPGDPADGDEEQDKEAAREAVTLPVVKKRDGFKPPDAPEQLDIRWKAKTRLAYCSDGQELYFWHNWQSKWMVCSRSRVSDFKTWPQATEQQVEGIDQSCAQGSALKKRDGFKPPDAPEKSALLDASDLDSPPGDTADTDEEEELPKLDESGLDPTPGDVASATNEEEAAPTSLDGLVADLERKSRWQPENELHAEAGVSSRRSGAGERYRKTERTIEGLRRSYTDGHKLRGGRSFFDD